jgi:hypothetical protein
MTRKKTATLLLHLTFKALWLLHVPPALTFRNSTFRPQGEFVYFGENSDYFLIQH